jgi:hypothetical protein
MSGERTACLSGLYQQSKDAKFGRKESKRVEKRRWSNGPPVTSQFIWWEKHITKNTQTTSLSPSSLIFLFINYYYFFRNGKLHGLVWQNCDSFVAETFLVYMYIRVMF